jgi:hypothetical protein
MIVVDDLPLVTESEDSEAEPLSEDDPDFSPTAGDEAQLSDDDVDGMTSPQAQGHLQSASRTSVAQNGVDGASRDSVLGQYPVPVF